MCVIGNVKERDFWKQTRPLRLLGGQKETSKIHMLHYINRENNPGHHGGCLYGSESISICSFWSLKGPVHFAQPEDTDGKIFRGVHRMGSCFTCTRNWNLAQEVFSGCFCQSSRWEVRCAHPKALHLPCVQTGHAPWHLQRNGCKIWEPENICELHCSRIHYRTAMQP